MLTDLAESSAYDILGCESHVRQPDHPAWRIMSAEPIARLALSATAMGAAWPEPSGKVPRFADRLEACGAASLFGGFQFLPLDCASALGGALARRIGPFLGVSKRAHRSISRAFPELSETEMTRVAAGMRDNLGRVAAEYPHLLKIRVCEAGGRVEKYGFEHVDRAVAVGRRIIVFSGHIANWEIVMLAGIQHGIPVAQIYRAANNPLLDRMIARCRGD